MDRSTVSRRRSESSSLGRCNGSSSGTHATNNHVTMLRFRPIAPKPVTGIETVAVDGSDHVSEMKNLIIPNKRRPAKRKYDKTRSRESAPAKKKRGEEESRRNYMSGQTDRQVADGETLSTPVYSCRKRDDPSILFNLGNNIGTKMDNLPSYFQKLLHMGSSTGADSALWPSEHPEARPEQCFRYPQRYDDFPDRVAGRAVESSSGVLIAEVNNISNSAQVDALELGWTDTEKMKTLAGDKLPGFVSDSSNKVIWVNRAFEAMIYGGGSKETAAVDPAPEVVVKDRQLGLPETCRAFSCQVKLRRSGKVRGGGGAEEKYDMIPCDVWRMDLGGFAWRLDVKTALTLGYCYYQHPN